MDRTRHALSVLALLATTAAGQTELFAVDGASLDDFWGEAVAVVGDVDGDGTDDFAVGAPRADLDGNVDQGAVVVYSGRTCEILLELEGGVDFFGNYGTEFGAAVAGAGDLDADGIPDVIVGAPNGAGIVGDNEGNATVFSGADGSVLLFEGGVIPFEEYGHAVAGLGDVDGDGVDDVAVGCPYCSFFNQSVGRVDVLSGADGSVIDQFGGFTESGLFGFAVASVGDRTGDGVRELVVGAPEEDFELFGTVCDVGAVYVIDPVTGVYLTAGLFGDLTQNSDFGAAVGAVDDLDGDGLDEILIGAPAAQAGGHGLAGRALIWGTSGGTIQEWFGTSMFEQLGSSVAGAGDIDGDLVPDVIVGALDALGRVDVLSGATGALIFDVAGTQANSFLGTAVAAVDVTGDGVDDVIAGAPGFDVTTFSEGRVFVFAGTPCEAAASSYGEGWPGTLGEPTLAANADPQIGETLPLEITNSLGAPTTASLLLGAASTALPLKDGTLLVDPLVTIPLSLPVAPVVLAGGIPKDATLCGVPVFVQVVEVDPGASKGLSFSRGLRLTLGG